MQLLQLVHGRADESLREPATLPALAALAAGGYVGRADAAAMGAAYRFLRGAEHLLQLRQLRRTHLLPEDPVVLREIGRAIRRLRLDPQADGTALPAGDPAEALLARWRKHAGQARQLHEKLFYRPLLDAVARLPGEVTRLTPAAAAERLEALGYADPAGALRHLEALTSGVSRKAAIQRTLLPVLLGWLADAPEPDPGLLAFRQVSEALGGSPWYLRLLRDNALVAAAAGPAAGVQPVRDRPAAAGAGGGRHAGRRQPAARPGRRPTCWPRRGRPSGGTRCRPRRPPRCWRSGAASCSGSRPPTCSGWPGSRRPGSALTELTRVSIAAVLDAAVAEAERSAGPLPTRIAVIAHGPASAGRRWATPATPTCCSCTSRCPAASDEAATQGRARGGRVRPRAAQPCRGPDPALLLDAGLRPEGRQGPLVRTLASYRAYYRRWSLAWESQALLRAEFAAGDAELGLRVHRAGR